MKTYILTLSAMLMVACAPDESNKASLPTEVGNGARPKGIPVGSALQHPTFKDDNYGFQLTYDPRWQVKEDKTEEGRGVIFTDPKTNESVKLRIHSNPAANSVDYFAAVNDKTKKANATIKIGAWEGLVLQDAGPAKLVMANSNIVIEMEATTLDLAKTFFVTAVYVNPECSRFSKGMWVQFQNTTPGLPKAEIITLTVEDIDLEKNKVSILTKPSGVRKQMSCRSSKTLLIGGANNEDWNSTRAKVTLDVPVELNHKNISTVLIEEKLNTVALGVGAELSSSTYFSDAVSLFGIAQQELKKDDAVIERWTFVKDGTVDQKELAKNTTPLVSISEADRIILTSIRSKPIAIQLEFAKDFLARSKPLLAFQVYNDLLENKKSRDASTLSEIFESYLGRAFTRLVTFTEDVEYQDLIQRMGFNAYSGSQSFFGPLGFLSIYSTNKDNDFCVLPNEDHPNDKKVSHLLPFAGAECSDEKWQIFGRSTLESMPYRDLLPTLITTVESIIVDLQTAAKNEAIVYTIPSGIHFGQRRYTFYNLEVRALEAALWGVLTSAHAALAYDSINYPVGQWFGQGEKTKGAHNNAKRRAFLKEFNRGFLNLKDMAHVLSAKKAFETMLQKSLDVIDLAQNPNVVTNYVRIPRTQEFLDRVRIYITETQRSLKEGLLPWSVHVNHPRINAKDAFEKPFDSKNAKVDPFVLIPDRHFSDGRLVFERNYIFFRDWIKSATPDREVMIKRSDRNVNRWFPGFTKEQFRGYGKMYAPVDFANHYLIRMHEE